VKLTTRQLHQHPFWLDIMLLNKIHKDTNVHVAGLDHLGENEALRGRTVKTYAGQKGGGSGSMAQTEIKAYLLIISKGRLHDGSGLPGAVKEEEAMKKEEEEDGESRQKVICQAQI